MFVTPIKFKLQLIIIIYFLGISTAVAASNFPNRQKRYIYKEACKLLDKKTGKTDITKRQIARMLGIAPVTLYRIEKYHVEES